MTAGVIPTQVKEEDIVNINEHIAAAKAAIQEGREEAAAHILAVLDLDPSRKRGTLCKQIDPDGWKALDSRVARLQEKRRSEPESAVSSYLKQRKQDIRRARHALTQHPSLAAELLRDPEVYRIVRAETIRHEQSHIEATRARERSGEEQITDADVVRHGKYLLRAIMASEDGRYTPGPAAALILASIRPSVDWDQELATMSGGR